MVHEGETAEDAFETKYVTSAPTESSRLQTGESIGRYMVINEVGVGGMGIVYRAYDTRLQREVALKCVRSEVLSEEARARLIREAQAMAKLSHPNVVAVYDVELDQGRVIVAMEYVEGSTLRAWLGEAQRSWKSVVDVFVGAGRGLAAAHRAELLHRDFKPANVLLGPDGRARVTDFGLAVASSSTSSRRDGPPAPVSRLSRDSDTWIDPLASWGSSADGSRDGRLTMAGRTMGTPAYMAPEQHDPNAELDARVDQYAFCASLWHALTGRTPFPFEGRTLRSLGRLKLEGPPAWPRSVDVPRPIVTALSRGLSARPTDRYSSMAELLAELSFDPSTRRRRWIAATGMLGLVATTGVAVGAWQDQGPSPCSGARSELRGVWDEARRTEIERALAQSGAPFAMDVWERVEPVLDAHADAWQRTHSEICEATTVRGERSVAVMDQGMACLDRARRDMRATVGVLSRADADLAAKAHKLVEGLPDLERCRDIEALASEQPLPTDPSVVEALETLSSKLAEARALGKGGKYRDAQAILEAVTSRVEDVPYEPLHIEHALLSGEMLSHLGKFQRAEEHLHRALRLALAHEQRRDALVAAQRLTYVVGEYLARRDEGFAYARVAQGLTEHRDTTLDEQALTLRALANLEYLAGNYLESETLHRSALEIMQRGRSEPTTELADIHNNLGNVLHFQGREDEAVREHQLALAIRSKVLGPEHPVVGGSLNNLASSLRAQGKFEEARDAYEEALSLFINAFGSEHPHVAGVRGNLGNVLRAQGRLEEAENQFKAALEIMLELFEPNHPNVALTRANLATILGMRGQIAQSEAQWRAALEIWSESMGPDHVMTANALHGLGEALLKAGESRDALPHLEKALEIRSNNALPVGQLAETRFALGRALWASGKDRVQGVAMARAALRELDGSTDVEDDKRRGEIERWLAEH